MRKNEKIKTLLLPFVFFLLFLLNIFIGRYEYSYPNLIVVLGLLLADSNWIFVKDIDAKPKKAQMLKKLGYLVTGIGFVWIFLTWLF